MAPKTVAQHAPLVLFPLTLLPHVMRQRRLLNNVAPIATQVGTLLGYAKMTPCLSITCNFLDAGLDDTIRGALVTQSTVLTSRLRGCSTSLD